MANHDYYKLQRGTYPSLKPGSNWYHIVIDPSLVTGLRANGQPGMVAADNLLVLKTYANTYLKCGFWRVTTVTDGNSTADLGTAAGGQQCHAGMDINAAVTNWARLTTPDDVAPVTLTDGYLYWECLGNTITSGQVELLLEVVVPHRIVEDINSLTRD
jgi:hypothetical protein